MSNTPDNSRRDDGDEPPPVSSSPEISLLVDQDITSPVSADRIRAAAAAAARFRGVTGGEIGIRLTTDPAIREINRAYLAHDYATDVISFGYAFRPPRVEGELVVSVETARREASRWGWSAAEELILYVVHGVLHVAGMDDADAAGRAAMRGAEADVLSGLGITTERHRGTDLGGGGVDPAADSRPSDGSRSGARPEQRS